MPGNRRIDIKDIHEAVKFRFELWLGETFLRTNVLPSLQEQQKKKEEIYDSIRRYRKIARRERESIK